ncbi:Peroxiredoxin [Parapedobacter luteus]|uniref:Peroxiredoxin n=1 Tax=Parapedobacter luteus TaxID=623280 RepID=A0A1T5A345_9SPHI|nr:redoxin family protein [Parapedobacter luteus]SKB29199.1 Peroxiredoxin [Parapedobacter luteus]
MKPFKNIVFLLALVAASTSMAFADDPKPLPIGVKAPDFSLKGVDDKTYTLASFKDARLLVIIFTCNHCPTAQAYEDRIIEFTAAYKPKDVQVVAISPNSDAAIRLDELGYTDLSDSFEEMKIRHKEKGYNFPYLYDGEDQQASVQYGPATTPHAFVFDEERILRYAGRIDDDEHIGRAKTFDLRNAVDELLAEKPVTTATTRTFGCSVKWKSKTDWKTREAEEWKKEPVTLVAANMDTLKAVLQNNSGKYRLINFWATWCGPCVAEFSALVETDKMYRHRDFDFVTVSLDAKKSADKVHTFLRQKYASNRNFLFGDENKYDLIEAVDEEWQGALPYTILVSPEGEIVYRQAGIIEPLALRKAIVEQLGRYYP